MENTHIKNTNTENISQKLNKEYFKIKSYVPKLTLELY